MLDENSNGFQQFLLKISSAFQNLVELFNEQGIMALGAVGILLLIIVLSIILLKVSSQPFVAIEKGCVTKYENNVPGMLFGTVCLLFSFIILGIFLFIKEISVEFSGIIIGFVALMFFSILIMLIIVYMKKDSKVEGFAGGMETGICEQNGQMGLFVDGVCMTPGVTEAKVCKQRLEKCNKQSEEEEKENEGKTAGEIAKEKCDCEDEPFVSRGDRDGNGVADIGICEYEQDNQKLFGYSHPAFGKKCVDADKMSKILKKKPKYAKLISKPIGGFTFNPYQSTQCFGFPKDDLLNYDLKCKDQFGDDYGVMAIEGFGCPENDSRALCELNYQMGKKLEPNSTKCVPIGSDMNNVCNTKHKREKKTKYQKIGYKTIEFSGCPSGFQRAICDGNYYDGKQLFKNTTEPFDQSFNPNRICQESFSPLSFAERIITENCNPGYVRAQCYVPKQEPSTSSQQN